MRFRTFVPRLSILRHIATYNPGTNLPVRLSTGLNLVALPPPLVASSALDTAEDQVEVLVEDEEEPVVSVVGA